MALDYNLTQTGPEVQQILDDAPVTKAELAQEIADRQNAVSAEHDRATEAESALSESISAEHDRATEAESALSESISSEHDRATEAEENLAHGMSESISSERERAECVEQELRDMIEQGGGGMPSREIIDMINTVAADGSTLSLEMTPKLVFAGEPFHIDLTAKTSEYAKSIRVYHAGYVAGEGIGYELKVVDNVTVPHEGQTKYTAEFTIGGHRKTTTAILEAVRPCFYGAGNNYTSATNNMGIKKSPAGFYDVNVSVPGSRIYIVIPSTMTFNRVRMSGVDMQFDDPANVVVGGTAYKAYRSSNTYDVENLTIEIQ
jgi:hypothetical protein